VDAGAFGGVEPGVGGIVVFGGGGFGGDRFGFIIVEGAFGGGGAAVGAGVDGGGALLDFDFGDFGHGVVWYIGLSMQVEDVCLVFS